MSCVTETNVSVPHQLSLVEPSRDKLLLLAYCHILYHSAINDKECLSLAISGDYSRLQRRVASLGRQVRHVFANL